MLTRRDPAQAQIRDPKGIKRIWNGRRLLEVGEVDVARRPLQLGPGIAADRVRVSGQSLAMDRPVAAAIRQEQQPVEADAIPLTCASAAMGVRHEPSRSASSPRSASSAVVVVAQATGASSARIASSPARHSMPSAPCATAGSISSTDSTLRATLAIPRRCRPASASSVASHSPPPACASGCWHCRAGARW